MADKVWKKQIGNQRPQIEGQTTQWPNEKGQKDKKRSMNNYTENKTLSNMDFH